MVKTNKMIQSFIIPPSEKGIERRRRLADVLAQQGTSTEPVQSWTQGAARIAQSLAGAMGNYQANNMENQRTSALQQALSGGATPDQLMNSMEPELQKIAMFKQNQARQQFEDNRMAEMLRLAQVKDERAANKPIEMAPGGSLVDPNTNQPLYTAPPAEKAPVYTPYEKEVQKQKAQEDQAGSTRVKAAKAFIAKVGRIEQAMGVKVGPKGEYVSGNDDLFGPLQSNPYVRMGASVVGTDAESGRTGLESALSDAELDVAQMKLKGTGPVTENERLIARKTLPQLSNQDARTAWDILQRNKADAQAIIDSEGGGGDGWQDMGNGIRIRRKSP